MNDSIVEWKQIKTGMIYNKTQQKKKFRKMDKTSRTFETNSNRDNNMRVNL